MTQEHFLRLLKNTTPICLKNHRKKLSLEEAKELNCTAELHFIPNSGGSKDKDITRFNACFIDLDCGRDADGNYFNTDKVNDYKKKMMRKLSSFTPACSAIVETRNGVQCYWFLKDNITEEQWRKVERYLIKVFDADKQVKSPANQMRLPCTVWLKDRDNPFYCRILKLDALYYSYTDFSHHFNNGKDVIKATKKKDAVLKKHDEQVFNNYRDVFTYITQEVDLFEYLQEFLNLDSNNPNNFCCIFHDDKHPSASVFKSDGGTWLYSCRAGSCGFKIGNIIQVVQWKYNLSRHKAIEKICRDLHITYKENEEFKNLIMDNIRAIKDDIVNSHTDLYSVTYRYLPTLLCLHHIALETLQYADGNGFLFSISTGYLSERLNRGNRKTTTEDISFFALLELIRKIDINNPNVSPQYRKMIKHLQGDKLRHINVYSLPIYDLQQLRHCDDIAKIVKEKNIRKTDFTYDTVYNSFGREVADAVFPQVKGKRTHEPDEFLILNISRLLEIDGYFTLKTLKRFYRDNLWKFNETVFCHQIPMIMERLSLERLSTNNKIKEQYGITDKGYPRIFVKKGD